MNIENMSLKEKHEKMYKKIKFVFIEIFLLFIPFIFIASQENSFPENQRGPIMFLMIIGITLIITLRICYVVLRFKKIYGKEALLTFIPYFQSRPLLAWIYILIPIVLLIKLILKLFFNQ